MKINFDNIINKSKLLYVMTALFFLMSFIVATPTDIYEGLIKIIAHDSLLVTDYIVVGGLGATFFNVGLVMLICLLLLKFTNTELTGLCFAAIWLAAGFSFIGKNFVNILPIFLGTFIYSTYSDKPLNRLCLISLFATGLAPVSSFIWFSTYSNLLISIPLGIVVGAFSGFFVHPLSEQFKGFHLGTSLYNMGFTAGIITIILYAYLSASGFKPTSNLIISDGEYHEMLLYLTIGICVAYIIISSINIDRKYLHKVMHRGKTGRDFAEIYGDDMAMMNAGVLGIICVILALLFKLEFNGPVICSIFTVIGFGAYGKNIVNAISCMLGVIIASYIFNMPIDSSPENVGHVFALFFVTGLSPLASKYGFLIGVFGGFTHLLVVKNTAGFFGYMNLYNNGFATGLVGGIIAGQAETIVGIKRRKTIDEE